MARYEFMEDAIYPLTITSDRYNGTYSGGNFTAWHLYPDEVPDDIYSNDIDCPYFWSHNRIVCGKGRTVSEAVADLYAKLRGGID